MWIKDIFYGTAYRLAAAYLLCSLGIVLDYKYHQQHWCDFFHMKIPAIEVSTFTKFISKISHLLKCFIVISVPTFHTYFDIDH